LTSAEEADDEDSSHKNEREKKEVMHELVPAIRFFKE
jgi:hypothetical protein